MERQRQRAAQPAPDLGIAEESYGIDALIGMTGAGMVSLGEAAMAGARGLAAWFAESEVPSAATLAENAVNDSAVPARPEGIPDDWEIAPAKDGKGFKYIQPETADSSYVRTSSGNADSLIPEQRGPFIKWQVNGKSLDQYGNIVDKRLPQAHISPDDFNFIKDFFR